MNQNKNTSNTSDYRWIGKAVRRIDGVAKVRGELGFPGDIRAEGALYCKPVLAPYPHARLLDIQTSGALSVPGVVRVLTHRDIPGSNRYGFRLDHPVLCDDKTRYIGDMVAVVVAESEEAAEEGVNQVEIHYEPLDLITDVEQALDKSSVAIHPNGNILHQIHHNAGDVAAIFADPSVLVVEQTFNTQFMDHAFLETEAGIAFPEDGGVKVIAGGQNAYYDQEQVAKCLGLPLEKVRMIESYTGGAFGGKGDITVQIVIALAALLTQRPCRMMWSRKEHFMAGVKRHPAKIQLRTAATRDGKLLAQEARILVDTGAYAVFGDSILELMAENITGPYRFPNAKIDLYSLYTNNAVCGAFRGYGATQACFALEGQISEIARQLGVDEIEFRMRNLLSQGEVSGFGHEILLPIAVADALQAAAQHPLWRNRQRLSVSNGSLRRGIGVAMSMKGYGLGANDAQDYSAAKIELKPDGRYELRTGIIELGQGSYTALVQMAAEELGCAPEQIDFSAADTRLDPEAGTTAASRVTYAVGYTVVAAARELTTKIKQLASAVLEVPETQVIVAGDHVSDRTSNQELTLSKLAQLNPDALKVSLRQRIPYSDLLTKGPLGHPHLLYSSNVQLVQLSVDVETCEVSVERVVSFPEVGKVINRHGLEGQCEGGVAQGIGYALMEQVVTNQGRVINDDLTRYPIPTVADVPALEIIPIEIPEATGPFGAKGAAENATIPTAPAILDAIAEAIDVRFTSIPVTPERIFQALEQKRMIEKPVVD